MTRRQNKRICTILSSCLWYNIIVVTHKNKCDHHQAEWLKTMFRHMNLYACYRSIFFFVVISIDLHFKLNYEKGTQRVPLTLSSSIKFFFFQSIISYVFCEYSVVATSLRWKRVALFHSLSRSYTTTASVYSSFELSLCSRNSLFPSKSHYYSHFDMYSVTSFMEKWFAKKEFKCKHTKSADALETKKTKNMNQFISVCRRFFSDSICLVVILVFTNSTFLYMTICVCMYVQ